MKIRTLPSSFKVHIVKEYFNSCIHTYEKYGMPKDIVWIYLLENLTNSYEKSNGEKLEKSFQNEDFFFLYNHRQGFSRRINRIQWKTIDVLIAQEIPILEFLSLILQWSLGEQVMFLWWNSKQACHSKILKTFFNISMCFILQVKFHSSFTITWI